MPAVLGWAVACACAQDVEPLAVNALLSELRGNAAAYEAHLPSLTCREHIVSQSLRDGEVMQSKSADDLLRVLRRPGQEPPAEEQRIPLTATGDTGGGRRTPQLPLLLSDGFFAGQTFFLDGGRMACLQFSATDAGTQVRLDFHKKEGQSDSGCRTTGDGLEGWVLVDRASGQMVYQQRRLPMRTASEGRRATVAEITYAPVLLGAETYWLPLRIYAEFGPGFRYTATYSGCKRFTVNSRILDGVSPE